jgi:hypothetical protein
MPNPWQTDLSLFSEQLLKNQKDKFDPSGYYLTFLHPHATKYFRLAIQSAGLIINPTLYQRLGGGGLPTKKGVGGFSGLKDKTVTDNHLYPAMLYMK